MHDLDKLEWKIFRIVVVTITVVAAATTTFASNTVHRSISEIVYWREIDPQQNGHIPSRYLTGDIKIEKLTE